MAIFSPLQQDVSPMQANVPQGLGAAPAAEALAGLTDMFLRAATPSQTRAPTQNEVFGARVREYGERLGKPNWNTADATMGELRGFGAEYPEHSQEAFTSARSAVNESVLAYENSLTAEQQIQEKLEFDWNTSPEGIYANAKAAEYQTPEERAAFIGTERARWVTTNAENTRIKREVETQGAYTALSETAWKNNSFFAKTESDILARGLTDLTLAISADPTATFNLDETGITQLIPELRGTVVNQRNIVSVANTARGALESRYRKEVSSRTGIPDDQLGLAPDAWNKTVFNTYDTTLTFITNEVDPATIQKRLEGEAFTEMASAGVPVAYLSTMSRLAGSNPTLSAQFMSSLTGPVGAFNERLMSGQLEEAQQILKQASTKELTDARYAFTELVAVMSGQSKLAVTYEEVEQKQKDEEISKALTGAYQAHTELQRTEGPTRWNRAAWKQNFEVPAEAIARRAAVDKDFALSTSQFLSSDIMMDLGNLRDAASANGVNINISENGQVVVSATPAGSRPGSEAAFTGGVGGAGVARRPLTPGDKLDSFVTEKKALIDDINYKMTVLGRLGETGSSTMDILRAEVPGVMVRAGGGNDELGGGSGSDSLNSIGASLGLDFSTLEAENGLPAGFLERTAFLESRGNPRAKNPDSSAGGLFQQIDDNARAYGVKDRFDPVQSTDGAVDFAVDNMRILTTALGREPTAAELYLAHQQGGEGARRLLANPNAKAVDIVGAKAVRLNGGNVDMTAGEFASLWLDKFNNTKTTAPTAGTPANANAVAERAGPAVQRAVGGAPSAAPVTVSTTTAPTATTAAPMETVAATLPEAIPAEGATGTQGASEPSPAIALDQDVQAFIQEIAGDPDKTYASEAEFVAAQEAGELEAGDTAVVDGSVYVVRKNGSVRRLGSVGAEAGDGSLGGGADGGTLNDSIEWSASSGEPFIPREGDTIQTTEPTLQEKSFDSVFSFLTSLGVDKGAARSYTARLVGTKSRVGVTDLTPVGSAFMVEEGVKTVAKGIENGDPATIAQGAAEAGLGAISAIPAVSLVGKGLSNILKAAPTNNIRTVVRTDNVFRGEGAYKTSLDKPTKPYAVRVTGESQVEDMIRSGLVRSKEGGYQGKNTVYYGEMDDMKPTSIFTKPKAGDKQKNYTIVADSNKIAGSSSPATLDDLLHVWTIKDGGLVDVLPELRLLNNMVQ
jgi:hypothetical protein